MYAKQLPKPQELEWLGKLVGPYPVYRDDLLNVSREYGFREIVTKFLRLFPSGVMFESRDDFVTRSVELEELIHAERASPHEYNIREED